MSALKKTEQGTSAIVPVPAALAARMKSFAARRPAIAPGVSTALEVVFFCDTTGSMFHFFDTAREGMERITDRLGQERVKIRCAVYAYKNHGDEDWFGGMHPFMCQSFTDNLARIKDALGRVEKGGGGDGLCAVEDAFHHLNREVSTAGSGAKRVAIAIGDMPPHGVVDGLGRCPHKYDYRAEVAELHRKGFAFYSVFCFGEGDIELRHTAKIQEYYRWLAGEHGGKYLELGEMDALVDVLVGICLKETGRLDSFIAELNQRATLPATTQRLLLQLKAPNK